MIFPAITRRHGSADGAAKKRPTLPSWLALLALAATGGASPAADDRETELGQLLPRAEAAGQDQDSPPAAAAAGPSADPTDEVLRSVRQKMQQARLLLSDRDTSGGTQQLQRESLEQLRALIDQFEDQGGASAASAAGTSDPRQSPPADGSGGEQGPEPPADEGSQAPSASSAAVKRVWGQLPAQLRQRMRAAGVEEFLPHYGPLIEAYYKRLAESPLHEP